MEKKITVYVNKMCSHHKCAIQYLKNKAVCFEEKDICDPLIKQELLAMGSKTVPAFLIGNVLVLGFNRTLLDKLV